eukprot:2912879-Rhodomonas_salina.1
MSEEEDGGEEGEEANGVRRKKKGRCRTAVCDVLRASLAHATTEGLELRLEHVRAGGRGGRG